MRYNELSPVPPLTKITKSLIITCTIVYLVDFIFTKMGFRVDGMRISDFLGLVPRATVEDLWLWQPFTYIFLHGHPLHILLNMLILWYFGAELEMRLGHQAFLKYFFVCGVGAGLFNLAVNYGFGGDLDSPIIGASGAIYGILAAYGIFFGERYFLVFFIFPMKAKYFVLLIAAIELISGAGDNPQSNVAHFAHLGGMVVGAVYIYWKWVLPKGPRKTRRDHEREKLKKQFTLIVNEKQSGDDDPSKGPFWN